MRLLEIFNHHEQPGGEAVAASQIFDLLGAQPDVEISRIETSSRLWLSDGSPPMWRRAVWTFSNPDFRAALQASQDAFRADAWITHNVFPVASAGVYAEALRLRVPIIQFVHNWRPFSISGSNFFGGRVPAGPLRSHLWREFAAANWRGSRIQTLWLGLVLSWLRRSGWLESVRAWVAVSDFARDRMIEAGLPGDRVFSLRHFCRPGPKPDSTEDNGHYLFLGRLIPEKGVTVLLDAWAEVRKTLGPRTPRLVICGSGHLDDLVARAAQSDPTIRAAGSVAGEEKERLLSGCRAVIVPSIWWEPLGLVVYEAYEHAKPVLAAASGGLTETVRSGQTGILHPPGDAMALAQHVVALQEDAALRARMGAEGRAWLEQNTGPDKWIASFREILASIATGAPPRCP